MKVVRFVMYSVSCGCLMVHNVSCKKKREKRKFTICESGVLISQAVNDEILQKKKKKKLYKFSKIFQFVVF